MKPRIVVLDGYTLNPGDLKWDALMALGECEIFDRTSDKQWLTRASKATILVVNKFKIDAERLSKLSNLEFVCVSATGYNNLDAEAFKSRGIMASNVKGYSASSVAQHVFANLLHVTNKPAIYYEDVRRNKWAECPDFSYWSHPIFELENKVLGIYGFGEIGQKVAKIALGFGMEIIAHHKHPVRDAKPGIRFVDLNSLFEWSDVLSLHAPLSKENNGIVGEKLLNRMKPNAILINTARGGLIDENALYLHLKDRKIQAACLDVLSMEPPDPNHIFNSLDNCYITPHQAWASVESRKRLLDGVVANIAAYLEGRSLNRVI